MEHLTELLTFAVPVNMWSSWFDWQKYWYTMFYIQHWLEMYQSHFKYRLHIVIANDKI